MVWLLRKCSACKLYTMNKAECPNCGGILKIPHPAKFSIDDRYREYKIRMKRMVEENQKNNSSKNI